MRAERTRQAGGVRSKCLWSLLHSRAFSSCYVMLRGAFLGGLVVFAVLVPIAGAGWVVHHGSLMSCQ